MIIDNSKLSFHDVMAAANKQQSFSNIEPGKVKTSHLIIGGVVIIVVLGVGYYVGKQHAIKLSMSNYRPFHSNEDGKE